MTVLGPRGSRAAACGELLLRLGGSKPCESEALARDWLGLRGIQMMSRLETA